MFTDLRPSIACYALMATGNVDYLLAGVISVGSPGLNYELATSYTITITMEDSGLPTKSVVDDLTVTVTDVAETLTVTNMPASFNVYENYTSSTAWTIFTVQATDPDNPTTFDYVLSASPYDGNFALQTGDSKFL